MVSTRQMSIINGGVGEGSNQNTDYCPVRTTRNSNLSDATEQVAPEQYGDSQPGTSSAEAGTYRVTRQCSLINTMALECYKKPIASPSMVNLIDMPQEIIEKIFGYCTFKNVCHLRLVCRKFDGFSSHLLNSTFQRLQIQMLNRFQAIKNQMPRRESARRNHPLACESDIIETVHMRLTLLQMSFGKHIERKHCCFFPGEILDEVYNILHYIRVTPKLQRPYKVYDELFDLSTMAMEYFKEKIEPDLPEIAYFGADFLDFTAGSGSNKYLPLDSSPLGPEEVKENDRPVSDLALDNVLDNEEIVDPIPPLNMVLRKRIRKIKQGMKRYNSQLSLLKQDLRGCKRKTADQARQISEQQRLLTEQQKQTVEYATRLDEYDKKNDEISRKFSTLLQELNKCKTELQYWRSKSPATPPFCSGCGNVMIAPPEDLEALINQGIIPEHLEPMSEFLPTPGSSNDINEDNNIDKPTDALALEEQIAEIPPPIITKSLKRKLDEAKDTPTSASTSKKTRRVPKIRSKRAKL